MIYKLGCFKCGEENNHDIKEDTNNATCPSCKAESSAFALIVDTGNHLPAKNKILKEALEFYASPNNYDHVCMRADGEDDGAFFIIEDMGGKKAREALKKIEELNKESE